MRSGSNGSLIKVAPARLQPFEAAGLRTAPLAEGPVQEEAMNGAVRRAVDDRSLHILVLGGGDIPLEADWRDLADLDPGELVAGDARDLRRALCAVHAAGLSCRRTAAASIVRLRVGDRVVSTLRAPPVAHTA